LRPSPYSRAAEIQMASPFRLAKISHQNKARGSAFNPNGTAGQMYAGQQPQNSGNPKSVSQYDVACSHQK